MAFLKTFYSTILDALFPISKEEASALSIPPEDSFKMLPRAVDFPLKEACSIFSYKDERMRKLVWALKYKRSGQAAAIGGFALLHILNIYASVAGPVLIIPMPITKQRRRDRGFNQCELLTDAIQKLVCESNEFEHIHIRKDLLIRARHKSRQTKKNRSERIESAHGLFKVNECENIQKDLLTVVVDDVITTGSTMKEAIGALRKAGFTKAFGLSLAH